MASRLPRKINQAMKKIVEFSLKQSAWSKGTEAKLKVHAHSDLEEELKTLCPQMEIDHGHLKFRIEWNTEMMHNLFEAIWRRLGLKPVLDLRPVHIYAANEFTVLHRNIFSKQDLDESPFLRLSCFGTLIHPNTHKLQEPDGLFNILPSKVNKKLLVGGLGDGRAIFCKTVIREAMETEGFLGLAFKPVRYSGKSHPAPERTLWQLFSSIQMPPVLNPLMDANNMPFAEQSTSCLVAELFAPPVLRFDAKEMERLGPFDMAITSEHFNRISSPDVGVPWLVVSQRLKRWLEGKKLPGIAFTPIAIEG